MDTTATSQTTRSKHTKRYCAVMCCAVLCCTVLYCIVLYCTAVVRCTVLTVLCCIDVLQATKVKNIDRIVLGRYEMSTWYYSPFPPGVLLCLCCAVLCCAVLCCAVLCCAALCCAVLCRVPCRAVFFWISVDRFRLTDVVEMCSFLIVPLWVEYNKYKTLYFCEFCLAFFGHPSVRCVVLCCAVLCLCCTVLCCVLCCAELCACAMCCACASVSSAWLSSDTLRWCAVLCMCLCCAVCCAVLCCAVLCCAVLCCAVLCCAIGLHAFHALLICWAGAHAARAQVHTETPAWQRNLPVCEQPSFFVVLTPILLSCFLSVGLHFLSGLSVVLVCAFSQLSGERSADLHV
jgi:hypothetical protein